ncbi:T9SS type A sorting domain-containing protein [Flavobacterium lindanitolerans]|uniref:Secreted protein (Por secretion system target) n=1 Tax=Flavobacterium lindanitolerans TaxID=428988 RepID=A0A497V5S0_9FLAO|nr:T9SS type A sorting domain-containing protein [Flavobacterium lindanitolerans]PKW28610.1 putative secreted protein (Por secretion system target) [Flavobacterium lindanitolerans]RLJ35885.1 putative secreted protein (Por secretion system target) [Flavobacterium lindanitolerans]
MRKFYILLLVVSFGNSYSQTTIFTENMGNTTATTAIASHTFQNSSPILFSGTADVRNTTPSENYEGVSGNGCVFLGGTTPAKTFIIEGINTLNYSDLTLSFGHYKGTNAGSNELTVQVSTDGTAWTPLTYTRPTGTGTSSWILITPSGTIPSTSNLRIKFENPISNVGFRIDDVKLTGNTLGISENTIPGLKVYPNPVTNGKLFITTVANVEKTIAIYDVLGKQVANTIAKDYVNVSNLKDGVYIVKITEEGKTATRKLVIK